MLGTGQRRLSLTIHRWVHKWVYSEGEQKGRNIGCLVYHPDGNCSWNLFAGNRICSGCLRNERVHEVVTTELVKSAYEILEERIANPHKKEKEQ